MIIIYVQVSRRKKLLTNINILYNKNVSCWKMKNSMYHAIKKEKKLEIITNYDASHGSRWWMLYKSRINMSKKNLKDSSDFQRKICVWVKWSVNKVHI